MTVSVAGEEDYDAAAFDDFGELDIFGGFSQEMEARARTLEGSIQRYLVLG